MSSVKQLLLIALLVLIANGAPEPKPKSKPQWGGSFPGFGGSPLPHFGFPRFPRFPRFPGGKTQIVP